MTNQLLNAKRIASARFLGKLPTVVGVGIGNKVINEIETDVPCVKVYVNRLLNLEDLSAVSLIPPEILGVATDVTIIGSRFSPLNGLGPGSSIRHNTTVSNLPPIILGTLGAVLRDETGQHYILSTNHVLSVNGRIQAAGSSIISSANPQITVARPGVFVRLNPRVANRADCALGIAADNILQPAFPRPVAGVKPVSTDDLGKSVVKFGAATDMTSGTIVDVSLDCFADFGFGTFRFADQVLIKGDKGAFAREGDSGAVVLQEAGDACKAVAMVFGRVGNLVAASPMTSVIAGLKEALGSRELNLVTGAAIGAKTTHG
jgi:hypothetical protein